MDWYRWLYICCRIILLLLIISKSIEKKTYYPNSFFIQKNKFGIALTLWHQRKTDKNIYKLIHESN